MINISSSFSRKRIFNRYLGYLLILCLIASVQLAEANPFCFARASSYYEQVYCELERKAQTKSIPPFEEFRKSSEQMQYSLLKRVADKNYIELPKPISTTTQASPTIEHPQAIKHPQATVAAKVNSSSNTKKSELSASNRKVTATPSKVVSTQTSSCNMREKSIICGDQIFQLIGNKSNQRLKADVLKEDYRMDLKNFLDDQDLDAFLVAAYNQYLTKMSDIGLAGVTMTYSKFVYFYHDIQVKHLNFSKRFETMYTYLKKDKAAMNASEKISLPAGLQFSACDQISTQFWACDMAGTNYVFASNLNY